MQNQYFSLKIHWFSSYHPYGGFVIWYSNSLDETATPLRILDRGVDFWSSKSRVFECMQRNNNFFKELTNVYRKSMTPIEDWRSEPRILSTKLPLNFASAIGVSIFKAPKTEFINVCSEIVTCFGIQWMYHTIIGFYSNFIDSQACTSMEDPWFSHSLHEPVRILDRGVDFWRPKIEFSNVCSDIIIFSQNWDMYYGKSTFFKITHLFSSLISPRIGFLALKWRRHQGVRSPPNPLSDRRKSLPDDPDIAPHSLRYTHLASPWLAERL